MRRHVLHAHKTRPARSERQEWKTAVDAARTVARRVMGTTSPPPGTAELPELMRDLGHILRPLKASGFPLQEASAVALAECFVTAGRALIVTALPDRQVLLAAVLDPAASGLWDLIEDLRGEEARGGWGRYTRGVLD